MLYVFLTMFRILQNGVQHFSRASSSPVQVISRPPHGDGRFEQIADWVFAREYRGAYLLIRSFPFNVLRLSPDELNAVREFFSNGKPLHSDLLELMRRYHMLDAEPDASDHLNRHVSAILLVTTSCNLACSHCFASGGDYGLGRAHMSQEVIDATVAYLRRQLEMLYRKDGFQGCAELGIHFFGGEPFIAYDRIRYAVTRAEESVAELSQVLGRSIKPDFFVTTNATLLNSERITFLKEHQFTVLISIDGPDHDARRQYVSGKGSLSKVVTAFRELRTAGIPLRINTVIRDADVAQIREILDWFQNEVYGSEPSTAIYHTFSFEREGPARTVGTCGNAYPASLLDRYVSELKQFDSMGYQLYEVALRNKLATGGTFYKCSSGVKRIAIGPTGRVYPCQGFVDTALDMGSILSPDFDHRRTSVCEQMTTRNIATLLPCRNCVFAALCPHNVDCAARAYYTLGGMSQIDVNGMCRIGFDLMDTILFERGLLLEYGAKSVPIRSRQPHTQKEP